MAIVRALPRPAPGTGRWWLFGTVAIVLAVAAISWVSLHDSGNRITATTVAYDVVDDSSVQIRFDVTRPPQLSVSCTMRALDGHFGVVGSAVVAIPPGAEGTTHHVATIRTAARAVTGVVQDCVRT